MTITDSTTLLNDAGATSQTGEASDAPITRGPSYNLEEAGKVLNRSAVTLRRQIKGGDWKDSVWQEKTAHGSEYRLDKNEVDRRAGGAPDQPYHPTSQESTAMVPVRGQEVALLEMEIGRRDELIAELRGQVATEHGMIELLREQLRHARERELAHEEAESELRDLLASSSANLAVTLEIRRPLPALECPEAQRGDEKASSEAPDAKEGYSEGPEGPRPWWRFWR